MNNRKLKYISGIIIFFLMVLKAGPLFNIHIHHETRNRNDRVVHVNKHDGNNCREHKVNGCQPESFFEHLFENGARIETDGNYFSDKKINYYDEQAKINNALILLSSYIINRVCHDNPSLSDFLIATALNPRSPPSHC
jgi:hypothetical protein